MNTIPSNKHIERNNFTATSGASKKEKTMEKPMDKAIALLAQRGERELPEYGDFAQVVEKIELKEKPFNVGDIDLTLKNANDKEDKTLRRIDLNIYSKSGRSKTNVLLELGNKKEILSKLTSENLSARIETQIQRASELFEDGSFA